MAVDPLAAPPHVRAPLRTCIGCRQRHSATELLRIVAAPDDTRVQTWVLTPDPRRRAPGRGAWVHSRPSCVALAERRRAYARALRVSGVIDPSPLIRYVEEVRPAPPAPESSSLYGSERNDHEPAMKRQR